MILLMQLKPLNRLFSAEELKLQLELQTKMVLKLTTVKISTLNLKKEN
jgi:hypothetical protein